MVGRYPTNQLIERGPLTMAPCDFPCSHEAAGVCGISHPFGQLFPTIGYVTHALLSRLPLTPQGCAFDLHVLGTPPAFVLSQDQTLRTKNQWSGRSLLTGFRVRRCPADSCGFLSLFSRCKPSRSRPSWAASSCPAPALGGFGCGSASATGTMPPPEGRLAQLVRALP